MKITQNDVWMWIKYLLSGIVVFAILMSMWFIFYYLTMNPHTQKYTWYVIGGLVGVAFCSVFGMIVYEELFKYWIFDIKFFIYSKRYVYRMRHNIPTDTLKQPDLS